jgi:prepilin-type processing-associated H-X9-DG protein
MKYDGVDGRVDSNNQTSHSGGVNVALGDGSVRLTDTSAVATLIDFDFPSSSSDTGDPLALLNADDSSGGAIAGIVISASTDNDRLGTEDRAALYDGSVRLLGTSDVLVANEFFLS